MLRPMHAASLRAGTMIATRGQAGRPGGCQWSSRSDDRQKAPRPNNR